MLIRCPRCRETLRPDARFCGVCGTTLEDSNVGRVIAGRYKLQARIFSGSLGVMYRAEQVGLGRKLAIKMLPADAKYDPQTVERFRREGEVLVRLRSAHTVTLYESDREPDGSLYIAMELVDGPSLAEVLRAEGPMLWVRVLRVMVALCDSLGEAHGLGVIHRDLRPENILLLESPRDFVKVLDFGLAKVLVGNPQMSPPGTTVGAVEYNSPEQLLNRPIDGRSDLYSLGVLAYLLLTGRHPFHDARSFGDMVAAQIHRVPAPASAVRSDVPADVDAILIRCLEKDPERRYPDAAALAATLNLLLSVTPRAETGDTIREPDLETAIGEEDTAIAEVPPRK